jgi:hypothetical protein
MRGRFRLRAAVLASATLLVAGCGSNGASPDPAAKTKAPADLAAGTWLLRFSTETGPDGESVGAVYVSLVPGTGATTVRKLPPLDTPDAYSDQTAVLVSADHAYALLDTRVPRAQGKQGRLTVYSTTTEENRVVDVRALTGQDGVVPVGAAFDPATGELLRVVDTQRRVWKLDLVAGTGVRDGDLPSHAGWIFANGFDKNTGLPYIEATDSEETLPAGNGADDVRAVQRQGGEVIDESVEQPGEPALPCGFASAFKTAQGVIWLFCADTPRITTYRLDDGSTTWTKVGQPSAPVVPGSASELPVVLPPLA